MNLTDIAKLERKRKRVTAERDRFQRQLEAEEAERRSVLTEQDRAEEDRRAAIQRAERELHETAARLNAEVRQAIAEEDSARKAALLESVDASLSDLRERSAADLAEVWDTEQNEWKVSIESEARRAVRLRLGFDVPEELWQSDDHMQTNASLLGDTLRLRVARVERLNAGIRPKVELYLMHPSSGPVELQDLADLARILAEDHTVGAATTTEGPKEV